jgi:hypothetical protein
MELQIIPQYADFKVEKFEWCQITYLYARELNKRGIDWQSAIVEAQIVTENLKKSEEPLTPNQWGKNYIHWPSMVCAANAYASLPPAQRERLTKSTHPAMILTIGSGGCERKVLEDEEYIPAPPCVPQTAAKGLFLGLAVFAGVYGGLSLFGWMTKKRQSQR